ncbi:hypothetical protein OEZ86_011925 [Tetradesmus obliquus]|nr:hypothetical protein OEZ86_011925 [Tetradesmus obliquus]
MAACVPALILLSAMAIATTTAHARVIMQGSEPPEFDCNQGCPATTSPVCAEGDITLQGACLAYCQKLTVKHTGPCDVVDGHGRVSGTDAVVAAFAPASSSPDASTASTPMQISSRAMNRFKSDGFVCIGRAVSSPAFKPRRTVLRDSSMPLQRPLPGPHSLRAIRVSAKDNLMYIEQASDTAARLASATTPEIMASTPPMAAPGSIEAPGGAAQDGGRCVPVPFGTKPAQTDVTPAQVPADKVITFKAKYPYAAIGRLDINGGTCSGSQIGDYTVLTAAHCVYDRKTKKWGKSNWRYEPATYRDSSGTRRYPYATNYVSYFTYFNAWIN